MTLRGLTRQTGVNQKQAKPLDADALAAIRATAFTPRRSRGGSLESEESALKRGRLDIALASVLSDAGLRVREAAQLRLRDVLDAEDGAGLVYIERSKTDQEGEGGMARAAGLGEGYSGRVGLAIRMTRRGAPLQAVQTHGRWKSPQMPARYTRGEKALEVLEWLV